MKAFIFLWFLAASAALADWKQLAPMPMENGGFAFGFIHGKLIVAGGTRWEHDQKLWLDGIWSYDPDTNHWRTLGKLPHALGYGVSAVVDDRLIIVGGSIDGVVATKEIVSVTGDGECTIIGSLPAGIVFAGGAARGHVILIAGGAANPADLATFTPNVTTIEIGKDKARVISTRLLGGPGFGIASGAAANGEVFVFGGARFKGVGEVLNLDTVLALSGSTQPKPLARPIRGITSVALNAGAIYLAGGYPSDEVGFVNEGFLFDPKTGSTLPTLGLPIKAMVHLACDGEWVYCLGGEDRKKHRTGAMWRIPAKELMAR